MKIITLLIILIFEVMAEMSQKDARIVVVGAGAAGIASATRLLEKGFNNVIVLEVKDRIGGRIESVQFGESLVDLGAEFCHGEKDNIVYELVKNLNVLVPDPSNPNFFYANDNPISDELKDRLNSVHNLIYLEEERHTNDSMGSYFTKRYFEVIEDTFNEEEQKIAAEVMEVFRKRIIRSEGSFSWFNVAAESDYSWCEGLLSWNWNGRGFKTILDVLMQNIQDPNQLIHFNKDVVGINWEKNTIIRCADGTHYEADHLIVTVSLGVLKAEHQALFAPSLPIEKIKAIERLGMQAPIKVFCHFPQQWWTDTFGGVEFVWNATTIEKSKKFLGGPQKGNKSWIQDILGVFPVQQNSHVLKIWIAGEFVPEIELMSDKSFIDGLMYVLKLFLIDRYPDMSNPNKILRHNWYSDKHFRGSYSFQGLNAHKGEESDEVTLSLPLLSDEGKPIVLFAGEATHPKYYSTVHGAIETGLREADRVTSLYL